jgi:hypothetical protein
MATLATFFTRIVSPKATAAETAQPREKRAPADLYRLRTIPNEDIYFYVKSIDNTRVVREADPVAPRRCWKMIATGCAAAVLLIGLLLPGAASLLAGYQIQNLREQQRLLINERAILDLEEARLVSPERLQQLAEMQKFIDPEPGHVVYLPSQEGSLALNVPQK